MKKILVSLFTLLNIFQFVSAQAIFEPEKISLKGQHDDYITFDPKGNYLLFTRLEAGYRKGTIFWSEKKNNTWQQPTIAFFSGKYDDSRPFVTPDGKRIFFASNRPTEVNPKKNDLDIWYIEKNGDKWTEPINAGASINSVINESHPSVASNGNLYFVRRGGGVSDDIYWSAFKDGAYQLPKAIKPINSGRPESHVFISPDESFLLFGKTIDNEGMNGQIFISINKEGQWSLPMSFDEVNSNLYDYSTKLSTDKKKIYFSRANFNPGGEEADIYFKEVEWEIIYNKYLKEAKYGLPEGSEEKWFHNFISIFNTGDTAKIKNVFKDGSHSAYYINLYHETGPLVYNLQEAGAYWCKGKITKAWFGLVIGESNEGFYIRGVRRGIPPASAPAIAKINEQEIPVRLDEYFSLLEKEGYFNGSVLVSKKNQILFKGSYGLANRSRKLENTDTTQYCLASVGKLFIGVAIAKLKEDGKLNYEDLLSKFIPEYPKQISDKITLHHLLTHTSGIELDDMPEYRAALTQAKSLEDILKIQLKFVHKLPQFENFQPLTGYDYTNEGVDLLGVVITKAAGMDWKEYITKSILKPLGLRNTGFIGDEIADKKIAKGFSDFNEDRTLTVFPKRELDIVSDIYWKTLRGAGVARPAGGIYSTTLDLNKLLIGLSNGKIITSASFDYLITPKTPTVQLGPSKRSFGYVFQINENANIKTIGHSGSAPGYNTLVTTYPDFDFKVIVLSNQDQGIFVNQFIEELILASMKN